MKIYLISQSENMGYDTYDSAVVCAHNEDDAKTFNPDGTIFIEGQVSYTWAEHKSSVNVEEIGEANENQTRGVILASFNAG